jgi:hypothetical protein
LYFCTACHSCKPFAAQGMSRERWDESLDWMVKHHNMPDVQGEDRELSRQRILRAGRTRRKSPFTPK